MFVILTGILSLVSFGTSLNCFQCSSVGKIKCPTPLDSKLEVQKNARKYVSAGDGSKVGCSIQIGYSGEIVYQGVMYAEDCKNKKNLILSRVRNFTCCFSCNGCNWNWENSQSTSCLDNSSEGSELSGGSKGNTTLSALINLSGLDYKLASIILLVATVVLSLIVTVLCCLIFNPSCGSSSKSPAYPDNSISPTNNNNRGLALKRGFASDEDN